MAKLDRTADFVKKRSAVLALSAALLAACSSTSTTASTESSAGALSTPAATSSPASTTAATATAAAGAAAPQLTVTPVMTGLDHPWDVRQAADGTIIADERAGKFVVKRADGTQAELTADLSDLHTQGETGLMGMVLAADFDTSRTIYTCMGMTGAQSASGNDIGVVSWTVDPGWTSLTRTGTVLRGIPVSDIGRHGGCRILAHPDGTLYVGTGDNAQPSYPQDPNVLGGKVLHINTDGTSATGQASPVFTLGHRNVQGLAIQPGTGRIYEMEQGTDRDDELNLLTPGGNYGYKPDRKAGVYDESVAMTDTDRVPGSIPAVWSSGKPTIATPDLAFASGAAWGPWDGSAVVPSQQGQKLEFLKLSEDGKTVSASSSALVKEYGRLRALTALSDGSMLLTTDNGSTDQVLLITPS